MGTDEGDDAVSGELFQLDFGSIADSRPQQQGRAGLTQKPWTWHDLVTYPTIV